ncbi:uncharacterized protein KY384_000985 [Bacidia gigantensis]|uniref:uncharacterized protein n=1 Tax=Bacidia gigantensis TaxID=2732470 RepID=UPI001D04B6C0|nr:uncharacterized protein KY384_000985 [Bacidia gigantensis]KAG8534141.1 hypothetical protein KY384_000985 [Bacidia gigantensis]
MSLQTDLNFSGTIEEDSEDNTIIKDASDDQSQDQEDAEQFDQCMESGQGPADSSSQTAPIQKRRRVTRACDECQCTYDQPSHRRRNPAPQYVEALETKLRRAEMLLQNYVPEVDLNDPSLDSALLSQEALPQKQEKGLGLLGRGGNWSSRTAKQQSVDAKTDSQLESMVEITGSLDLDDDGNWDFYGHSSGRVFLRKMREQFGTLMGKTSDPKAFAMPPHKKKSSSQPISSPSSSVQSPLEPRTPSTHDLPSKDYARLLCQNVLDDACAVLRFVHQPTFYAMFDRVYDLPPDNQGTEEMKFLPLLYSVIAVGALFATAEQSQLMTNGVQNAIQQG